MHEKQEEVEGSRCCKSNQVDGMSFFGPIHDGIPLLEHAHEMSMVC
jgi:hypothetical protein